TTGGWGLPPAGRSAPPPRRPRCRRAGRARRDGRPPGTRPASPCVAHPPGTRARRAAGCRLVVGSEPAPWHALEHQSTHHFSSFISGTFPFPVSPTVFVPTGVSRNTRPVTPYPRVCRVSRAFAPAPNAAQANRTGTTTRL